MASVPQQTTARAGRLVNIGSPSTAQGGGMAMHKVTGNSFVMRRKAHTGIGNKSV